MHDSFEEDESLFALLNLKQNVRLVGEDERVGSAMNDVVSNVPHIVSPLSILYQREDFVPQRTKEGFLGWILQELL